MSDQADIERMRELEDRVSWLETQREVECQQKLDAQNERDGFAKEADQLRARLAEALEQLDLEILDKTSARQLALESQCQRMRDALIECGRLADKDTDTAGFWFVIQQIHQVAVGAYTNSATPLDLELLNRVRTEAKAIDSICQAEMQPFDNEGVPQFDPVIEKIMEHTDALLKSLSPAP